MPACFFCERQMNELKQSEKMIRFKDCASGQGKNGEGKYRLVCSSCNKKANKVIAKDIELDCKGKALWNSLEITVKVSDIIGLRNKLKKDNKQLREIGKNLPVIVFPCTNKLNKASRFFAITLKAFERDYGMEMVKASVTFESEYGYKENFNTANPSYDWLLECEQIACDYNGWHNLSALKTGSRNNQ